MKQTTHYNATVEVATREVPDVDDLLEQLEDYHASVGQSDRGWLSVTMTLPADSLAQAARTALAVVATATGADPIASEVLTEEEFEARQGWEPVPDLVSVTEAAEELGVSRQAVLQRIDSKSLPATRVGRDFVIPRAAVSTTLSDQLRRIRQQNLVPPETLKAIQQLVKIQPLITPELTTSLAKIAKMQADMSSPQMRRAIANINKVAAVQAPTAKLVKALEDAAAVAAEEGGQA